MTARACLVLLVALLPSCTRYTTTFRSGKTPNDDPEVHERATVVDAFDGDKHFDLALVCPRGWAELTFEHQFLKRSAQVETWRCAK